MYEYFNTINQKVTKPEATEFNDNSCTKITTKKSKKYNLEVCNNSIQNHIILNNDDEKFISIKSYSNDILLNTNKLNFDIFNINISLNNAVEIKTENDFRIVLHHKQKSPIYISFDLPVVIFKPEDQYYQTTYSLLCYTNKGFFGVYPFNLGDLTDKSNLSIKHCEKGKLPCAFDIKINNVKIPENEDILLNICLVKSTTESNFICNKFIDNDSKEIKIDYKSDPAYMIMNNFKFAN